MMNYLFQSEVAAQTPVFVRKLGRLLFWLFFIIPSLMMFMPWLQNISATGMLTAITPSDRRLPVEAPISGIISKWNVKSYYI
jgi:hypothetical protein